MAQFTKHTQGAGMQRLGDGDVKTEGGVRLAGNGNGRLSLPNDRLRRWLGMLRQPDKLAAAPEVIDLLKYHGRMPDNSSPLAVGQAAASVLLEGIERLKPNDGSNREDELPYRVMNTCFVEGAKLFQAASRLGLSERQLTRERARAIKLLEAELTVASPQPTRHVDLPEQIPAIRDFLPRANEAYKLQKALASSRLVVVHGPPGIGKTSLVAEMAADAAEGVPVFWYRFRPEVNTSLTALVFELGEHLRALGSTDLSDYLEKALPDLEIDTTLATRLALRGLGGTEHLIVLDDYHLVEDDPALKGLLEESVERVPRLRIVPVSRHQYLGMMAGETVEIGPFARSQSEQLMMKLGVSCDPEMLKAIHDWTKGNPHMLKLAASWLKKASPQQVAEGIKSFRDEAAVQEFLLVQVTNLIDPDDQEVLRGASIFRYRFNDDALAHVTEQSRGFVVDSSIRLVRCYVATRNRDGNSAFFHHSIRDFVYARIGLDQRAMLHKRAAEWFELADNPREAAYHSRKANE